MAKCSACGRFLTSVGAASCTTCPSLYHKGCIGIAETASLSEKWACPECKKKSKKTDNSNTPVRSTCGTIAQDFGPPRVNIVPSHSDDTRNDVDSPDVDVRGLRRELAECMTMMREFRLEMANLRDSVVGFAARMDGIEQRLDAVERRGIEPANADVSELERTVSQLKLELNDRDQEALQSDIEIGHLPEEKGENVLHTITVLSAKLGVSLDERDVVFAERVGMAQGAGAASEAPRARRVVVRFARRHIRDEFLQAARVRRLLTATDAGCIAAGVSRGRIFVNERLTRGNRFLFYRVREECRRLQWRYSWTKRGRIYVRQADGKQAYQIRSEAEVLRVFGPANV